eukprot:gene11260-biopygen857
MPAHPLHALRPPRADDPLRKGKGKGAPAGRGGAERGHAAAARRGSEQGRPIRQPVGSIHPSSAQHFVGNPNTGFRLHHREASWMRSHVRSLPSQLRRLPVLRHTCSGSVRSRNAQECQGRRTRIYPGAGLHRLPGRPEVPGPAISDSQCTTT